MTALTERHDAQRILDRPLTTLADAGRAITAEHDALVALFKVAEKNVGRGLGGADLARAVQDVQAVRR